MINLADIVKQLHENGFNPGCLEYGKKIQASILHHYGVLEENLTTDYKAKLANFVKNKASKIKVYYDKARSIEKVIQRNKVRHFMTFQVTAKRYQLCNPIYN